MSEYGDSRAVATSEHFIRIVDIANPSNTLDLTGHEGPVKTVSWDPKGKYLASSSCDGSVKVWELSTWMSGNFKLLKTFENQMPKDHQGDIVDSDPWRPSWSPTGSMLALPGMKDVQIVGRASWHMAFELKNAHAERVAITLWSPNGLYLITYAVDKTIYAWNLGGTTREKVGELHFDGKQQSIKWCNSTRGVISLNLGGDFWVLDQLIPANSPSPTDELSSTELQALESQVPEMKEAPVQETAITEPKSAEAPVPTAANTEEKSTTGDQPKKTEEEDATEGTSLNAIKAKLGFGTSDDLERQRMMEQLEDTSEEAMLDTSTHVEEEGPSSLSVRGSALSLEQLSSLIVRQAAFQPGSTVANTNNSRYLAWNSIGVITSHSDQGVSSIEIDFADMKFHRKIRFTDHYGLSLGSLSLCGALFASPGVTSSDARENTSDPYDHRAENAPSKSEAPVTEVRSILAKTLEEAERNEEGPKEEKEEDEGERSVLFFKPFHGLLSNAEWQMRLPSGERAMSVACGSSFCAVATNRRLLRVLRPDGTQEVPVLLGGPIVAMVGGGNLLFLTFHEQEPAINGTQNIGFVFYEVCHQGSENCLDEIVHGRLPVPCYEKDPLKWVGIADKSMGQMPVFADCTGHVYGLSVYAKWCWVPLLNESKPFWPVAVTTDSLMAVMLGNGSENGPRVVPRPVLGTIAVKMPMIGLEEGKVGVLKFKLEEGALNATMMLEQKRWLSTIEGTEEEEEENLDALSKQVDAKILKHFVLCLKLGKLDRAMGLIYRLRSVDAMEIAHVQASKEPNAATIIDKIESLIAQRKSEAADVEEELSEDEDGNEEEIHNDDQSPREQLSLSQKPPRNPFAKKTMALSPGAKPVNPFAKASQPNSKPKACNVARKQKSPSVTITPKLGRQSSFSQEARSSAKRRRVEQSR